MPTIADARPDLLLETSEDISQNTIGSGRRVVWRCSKDHQYPAAIKDRVSKGSGCPYCSGRLPIPGETDLATTHPKLCKELLDPSLAPTLKAGSDRKVLWVCKRGHTYSSGVGGRVRGHRGCPYCAGKQVLTGFNDLNTLRPDLTHLLKTPEDGLEVSVGSKKKLQWRCALSHEWEAPVSDVSAGHRCSVCSGSSVIFGVNDLSASHPELWDQLSDKTQVLSRGSDRRVSWTCDRGHVWEARVYNRSKSKGSNCPKCVVPPKVSAAELEIKNFIEGLGFEVVSGDRALIAPKELDLYVPEKSLAIEFNGTYWHQEAYVGRDKHYTKYKDCLDLNIQLLQIWDVDWEDARTSAIWRKKLIHILSDNKNRLGARETVVRPVSSSIAREFLDLHHLQGYAPCRFVGLFSKKTEELVAVMGVKNRPSNTKHAAEIEVVRYASSLSITGGLDKMLKFVGPGTYSTFADHLVSAGALYRSGGWTPDRTIRPDYRYLYNGRLEHKFNFRKARFKDDPRLQYRPELSETELAVLNSIPRIYDAGKTRYVKTI